MNQLKFFFRINLLKMNQIGFNETITFISCGRAFSFRWYFEISEETKLSLEQIRFWPKILLFSITTIFPLLSLFCYLFSLWKNWFIYSKLSQANRGTVLEMTVTEKENISTQCHFEQFEAFGGEFKKLQPSYPQFSNHHFNAMKCILDSIERK